MPRWIWAAALLGAALGDLLFYDTAPGLNWVLWTTGAAVGLGVVTARRHGAAGRPVYLLLGITIAVVAGTPMTANGAMHFGIAAITMLLLGTATLLTTHPDLRVVRPLFLTRVPFRAPYVVLRAAAAASTAGAQWTRTPDARPVLRGALITLPCVAILALLFSAADPTLAHWRDALLNFFPNWDVPQTIFAIALGVAILGAYTHAATIITPPPTPRRWFSVPRIGRVELRILLGSVTTLLALFILLQLTYLFHDVPGRAGSGLTYAEYAHRGYVELTIAAGIVIALVLAAEENVRDGTRDSVIRALQYIALGTIVIILTSALHRITLYEDAYGYTILRLYARLFAGVMLCTVACVAIQLARGLDVGQLSRQLMAVGLITFIGLTWWNEDAWVARNNLARAAVPGHRIPLDTWYLNSLSDDALPVIFASLPAFPTALDSAGLSFHGTMRERAKHVVKTSQNEPWYAWNYRRHQASNAGRTLLRRMPPVGRSGTTAGAGTHAASSSELGE
jgi:hypothetical protein